MQDNSHNPLTFLVHYIHSYSKTHNINRYDLVDALLEQKQESDSIPLSLFKNRSLSSLEVIVKYLKENLNLTSKKISSQLNRSFHTINSTYRNTKIKHESKFIVTHSKFFIPLSIFKGRELSVLGSIVVYMKEKLNLKLSEIAELLNRNPRTIWTVYHRARSK